MDKLNSDILQDALQNAGFADTHNIIRMTDNDFIIRRGGRIEPAPAPDFDVWMKIEVPTIKHVASPEISWVMDGVFVSFRDTLIEIASRPKISMADPNSFDLIAETLRLAISEGEQKFTETIQIINADKPAS